MFFGLFNPGKATRKKMVDLQSIADTLEKTPAAQLPEPKPATFREAYGVSIDEDEDQWRKLSGDTNRDLSPMTQSRMREMAVYLWESNLLANRLIELPLAYLLAEGVELTCEDEESQEVLDLFWDDPINQMDIKLPKKVRELALYGEQCYPAFVNELSGEVRLGYLDPNNIATIVSDPDNPEQAIGIVTTKDKKGVAKRYRVIINGPEDVFTQHTQAIRETFSDGDAFFFAVNDLSNGKRGRSDLLAQADWIDGYDQFLFGELDSSVFRRAFIWDVELKGQTPDEVKARAKSIVAPSPNSVRVHNDAEVWTAVAPTLNAQDTSEAGRLFRNHVLGGATLPENWFGGGGDVNRSTADATAEPTFKNFSMRQKVIKHILEAIGFYVLRQKSLADNGDEPDRRAAEFKSKFKVTTVFPEMTAKDTTKYAAALQQVVSACLLLVDRGFITKEKAIEVINSIAGRLGVEIDAEDEVGKATKNMAKKNESDVFTQPAVNDLSNA